MALFSFGGKTSFKTTGKYEREKQSLVGFRGTRGYANQAETTTGVERLNIDQAGIDKLIGDVLSAEGGIADIFSQQNVAGIYDSTVAAQAAGDLASNLVGELAQLTAERETKGTSVAAERRKEEENVDERRYRTTKGRETEFYTDIEGGYGV